VKRLKKNTDFERSTEKKRGEGTRKKRKKGDCRDHQYWSSKKSGIRKGATGGGGLQIKTKERVKSVMPRIIGCLKPLLSSSGKEKEYHWLSQKKGDRKKVQALGTGKPKIRKEPKKAQRTKIQPNPRGKGRENMRKETSRLTKPERTKTTRI